jgi:hypothetical protein
MMKLLIYNSVSLSQKKKKKSMSVSIQTNEILITIVVNCNQDFVVLVVNYVVFKTIINENSNTETKE